MLWLVASRSLTLSLLLECPAGGLQCRIAPQELDCQRLAIGEHAVLHLIQAVPPAPLPSDCLIAYDLLIHTCSTQQCIADLSPHLL